ncbi:hypothetical protein GGER_05700 [Serratia rubidaea]
MLTLTILPGVVGNIAFSENSDKYANLYTTFPGHKGDILDLRAIEQGLENIQRIPGADANVVLRPGEREGKPISRSRAASLLSGGSAAGSTTPAAAIPGAIRAVWRSIWITRPR